MTVTINGTTGIAGVDGSAATPAVQGADTNTGVFYGTDIVAISTGGTERVRVNASGQAEFTAGTAALPAITSTGDTNTGIFFPAADTIAFVEGGVESMRIDSSGYMQGTVNGLGAGRIPAMQYYRLNSGVVGANSTAAQSVLGVGVTLVASTQYDLDAYYVFQKTAGTTSHTMGLGFGGTATVNNILYGGDSNGGLIAGLSSSAATFNSNVSTNTQAVGTVSSASATIIIHIKGTVSINAGGTFIPQYTLSAAPGGAYTTQIGSYFRIWPLAASGSNVNVGTWA